MLPSGYLLRAWRRRVGFGPDTQQESSTVRLQAAGTALQVRTTAASGKKLDALAEDKIGFAFLTRLTEPDGVLVGDVIAGAGLLVRPGCDDYDGTSATREAACAYRHVLVMTPERRNHLPAMEKKKLTPPR